jgi:hypothetical protein
MTTHVSFYSKIVLTSYGTTNLPLLYVTYLIVPACFPRGTLSFNSQFCHLGAKTILMALDGYPAPLPDVYLA